MNTDVINLAGIEEDEKIRKIGEMGMAAEEDEIIAFMVRAQDGKMDRYLFKLFFNFPDLRLLRRGTKARGKWEFAEVRRAR